MYIYIYIYIIIIYINFYFFLILSLITNFFKKIILTIMPKVDNAIDKVGGRNEKTKHLFSFTIFFLTYQNFIKFLFYLL